MCFNEFGRAGIGILFGLRERPALNGYQKIVLLYNCVSLQCAGQ
jgi:hypothetical protein